MNSSLTPNEQLQEAKADVIYGHFGTFPPADPEPVPLQRKAYKRGQVRWPEQDQFPSEKMQNEIDVFGPSGIYVAGNLSKENFIRIEGDCVAVLPAIRALVRAANRQDIFVHIVTPSGTNLDGIDLPDCFRPKSKRNHHVR